MQLKFSNRIVNVSDGDFVARGGGGEIYVKKNVAYKVCHPGQMPPATKIRELASLDHPNIIRPLDVFKVADGREGYSMRYVPDASPLMRVVPIVYRKRQSLTPDTMLHLVRRLQEHVKFIHDHDILIVDLNELNFLISKAHDDVYCIDVDSYQTPSHPALALMPSVRDHSVAVDSHGNPIWTRLSDWYSFGILSFQLFVGMHPFQGRHPRCQDPQNAMESCMRQNLSILDPETKFPKQAVMPFTVIPDSYMQWYEALFKHGKRAEPPKDVVATIQVYTPKIHQSTSAKFVCQEIFDARSEILFYHQNGSREVIVTTEYQAFVDRKEVPSLPHPFVVGWDPGGRPVAANLEGRQIRLYDMESGTAIPFQGMASQIMSSGGRLYARSGPQIIEIDFKVIAGKLFVTPSVVLQVMEHANQMFDGVVFQNLFDTTTMSVFPSAGRCVTLPFRVLDDLRIVDARREGHVLVCIAVDPKNGKYSRLVARFSEDWSSHDIRIVSPVPNTGVNFAVRDDRRAALLGEEGDSLEIFLATKDHPTVTLMTDPALSGGMRIWSRGNEILFSLGGKLSTITAKKS